MEHFIGIDVSKATRDIASLPDEEFGSVTNDDPGLAELAPRLLALAPTLVVLEATGGFESPALAALAKAGSRKPTRSMRRSSPSLRSACGPLRDHCPTKPRSCWKAW